MKTSIKTFITISIFIILLNVKSFGWTAPTLASPSSGTSAWTGLTLDWNAVSASQQYQLQVDTSPNFNSLVLFNIAKNYINSSSSNSDTELYLENLYFGKTYYWHVRAYITGDTSVWSTIRTFNTKDYVSLISPTSASSQWTGLTLDWAAHPGVDFYDLEVDTSNLFNSTVLVDVPKTYINSSSSNSDTEHYLENLYFGKKYYWRVRARNAVDTSAWSTAFMFNSKDYVSLISPTSGSSQWTGLTLDWAAHTGVDFYDLEVDTTNLFNSTVLVDVPKTYINSSSSNSDTEHYLENLYFGKTYYWRVRARNAVDTSTWSTVFTFNTKDYVSLISPTSASSQWTGLTLDWAAHTGVDFYDLEVDTTNLFNSTVLFDVPKTYINSSSNNSDTEHYLENLYFGKTYYWRVRARNVVDTSAWSTAFTFNTKDYVSLVSPADQQINVNTVGITLDWNTHTGISIYQLQIDTMPLFNSLFLIEVNKNYINSSGSNSDTQYGTGTLLTNHIYYWRVRAINNVDTSAWTSRVFSTGSCSPSIQPIAIIGSTTVCSGNPSTYSIAAVSGATSYSWILPSGWIGFSLTNSISITPGSTSGTISVIANNSCGPSVAQTLNVTISGSIPATPAIISGNSTVCSGSQNTYTAAAVSGATSYIWTLPSGWVGSSITNSITPTSSSTSGTISVKATNACGSSSAQNLIVIISGSIPATPGIISGNATVCSGSSNTYTIATVSGATNYIWSLPNGWTGSSTTNSITSTAGGTSGTISVMANNTCGSSSARTLISTVSVSTPAVPGAISGNTTICSGSSNTYSIAAVSDAMSYTWTLPNGWTGSSTTNSITSIASLSSGTISVKSNNSCGSSSAQILSITIGGSIPATPGTISGTASVCSGSSNTYSIATVSGATSYIWTLPNGWTGSSTTNFITTTAGSASGTISVKATNNCGSSSAQTFTSSVSVSPPVTPGTISGIVALCSGSSNTYSIATVSGATSYTWTLPNGWTGSSSSNSIVTTANSTSGTISVMATNSCGSSSAQTLITTVSASIPATPGTISGTVVVCPESSNTYSITAVSDAISYTWTLPNGWTGSSTTNSIITTAGSTSGTISIKSNNSCGSSAAQIINVTVNAVNTSVSQAGATLMANETVATYQWLNCNGYSSITGQTTQSFTPAANGNYAVIVTQNGCNDTSSCYTISTTSISAVEPSSAKIDIYPNPSNGKFIITIAYIPFSGFGEIEIFNILGEKIYSSEFNQQAADEINLSNSPKGIYLVKIYFGEEIYNKKIIVL